MSRIYDALKKAERDKSDTGIKLTRPRTSTGDERRRGRRRAHRVSLMVYGTTKDNVPFLEATHSLGVSENGALLILSAQVVVGQKLMLLNQENGMEQEVTVVRVGQRRYKMPVGVRFSQPSPEFWETSSAQGAAAPSPLAAAQATR